MADAEMILLLQKAVCKMLKKIISGISTEERNYCIFAADMKTKEFITNPLSVTPCHQDLIFIYF